MLEHGPTGPEPPRRRSSRSRRRRRRLRRRRCQGCPRTLVKQQWASRPLSKLRQSRSKLQHFRCQVVAVEVAELAVKLAVVAAAAVMTTCEKSQCGPTRTRFRCQRFNSSRPRTCKCHTHPAKQR